MLYSSAKDAISSVLDSNLCDFKEGDFNLMEVDGEPTPPDYLQIGENLKLSGTYGMLSTSNTKCLQGLSNKLVEKLSKYLTNEAKSTIPEWIYTLPIETQQEKIKLINEYGSPNVFDDFIPHVTLTYDEESSRQNDYVKSVSDLVLGEVIVSGVEEVGFGVVGVAGSVVRGVEPVLPSIGVGGGEGGGVGVKKG